MAKRKKRKSTRRKKRVSKKPKKKVARRKKKVAKKPKKKVLKKKSSAKKSKAKASLSPEALEPILVIDASQPTKESSFPISAKNKSLFEDRPLQDDYSKPEETSFEEDSLKDSDEKEHFGSALDVDESFDSLEDEDSESDSDEDEDNFF